MNLAYNALPYIKMSTIVSEVLDGFVTAVTFKTLDLIMTDRSLEEQKRYNDAMINLERERLEWDKRMDRLRNELEHAQREKNEARQSEIETRIRLNNSKRLILNYQPSKTFNKIRASVMVTLGVGGRLVVNKLL